MTAKIEFPFFCVQSYEKAIFIAIQEECLSRSSNLKKPFDQTFYVFYFLKEIAHNFHWIIQ